MNPDVRCKMFVPVYLKFTGYARGRLANPNKK